jgi:competence ComEA-like helix-hairpin-helix protein
VNTGWLWTAALLGTVASAQSELPAGPGKDVVERVCAPCHGVYPLMQRNRTKEAWGNTVDRMIGRGAKAAGEDAQVIVQYLYDNFGVPTPTTINVNKAGVTSLTNFLNLFPEEADAIIAYRDKNGSFKDWQDLTRVPGLNLKNLEERKDRIVY